MPSAIVFGSVVDGACLIWRDMGCGKKGSCWFYDNVQFWYSLHGMQVSFMTLNQFNNVMALQSIKHI